MRFDSLCELVSKAMGKRVVRNAVELDATEFEFEDDEDDDDESEEENVPN